MTRDELLDMAVGIGKDAVASQLPATLDVGPVSVPSGVVLGLLDDAIAWGIREAIRAAEERRVDVVMTPDHPAPTLTVIR